MDEGTLHTFRSLAQEVRAGFEKMKEASGELRVVHGYLESKDMVDAYRSLCLPVRRAYNESDRVSFRKVCVALRQSTVASVLEGVSQAVTRYEKVLVDLNSTTTLNDRQLLHREVFDAWLDASVFGDFAGKDRKYRALLDECGKAVEGIAVRITELVANQVLELDDLVADALGEERRS
ncbi:MAG: hypothetical protein JSW71_19610 [Gemmatimonadota bacterium]|nr:MAG: hypothetical protein JSW71_19610 [Gemmatimonadota bacterium]